MSRRHGLSIPPTTTEIYFNRYFPGWKSCVNNIINQHTGFILNDLPDFPYADNFDIETEANKILDNAKKEANAEALKLRDQLRIEVSRLAIKGAEQILEKQIDEKVHIDILKKLEAEL